MGDMADYYTERCINELIEDNYFKRVSTITETKLAVLYELEDNMQMWLPKSVHTLKLFNVIAVEGWFTPTIKKINNLFKDQTNDT